MIEFLTSRSRALDFMRCPRARWWLHEARGTGFQPVKVALPLATGSAVHAGLARMLQDFVGSTAQAVVGKGTIKLGVDVAIAAYEDACKDRGLDLDQLESQSFVYGEQKALVEALVRLAGMRVVPRLLEMYEILEVERLDTRTLYEQDGWRNEGSCAHHNPADEFRITWRSIPDALMRSRSDGQLYLLSWKTCSTLPKDDDARVDMQGVSEAWAIQGRLDAWWQTGRQLGPHWRDGKIPGWFGEFIPQSCPKIRGVQMVYLVKGQRRDSGKEAAQEQGLSPEQIQAGGRTKKTASPLIYGYKDSSTPVNLAWDSMWRCSAPHPMRKSQWYPTGECPGDGRNHKRSGDWSSFPVWIDLPGGVAQWLEMLDEGHITPEAGDVLDAQWALPVPNYRTQEQLRGWLAQTRASEVRIAKDLLALRQVEVAGPHGTGALETILDESVLGPQDTTMCNNWFGRKCGAYDLCWGPPHIAEDPVASGIYQIKPPYKESVIDKTSDEG